MFAVEGESVCAHTVLRCFLQVPEAVGLWEISQLALILHTYCTVEVHHILKHACLIWMVLGSDIIKHALLADVLSTSVGYLYA